MTRYRRLFCSRLKNRLHIMLSFTKFKEFSDLKTQIEEYQVTHIAEKYQGLKVM